MLHANHICEYSKPNRNIIFIQVYTWMHINTYIFFVLIKNISSSNKITLKTKIIFLIGFNAISIILYILEANLIANPFFTATKTIAQ